MDKEKQARSERSVELRDKVEKAKKKDRKAR